MGQRRLIQLSILLPSTVVLRLRPCILPFPRGQIVLPAVVMLLFLFVQQVILLPQSLSLPVVGLLRLLLELRQHGHQLLHIPLVCLLSRGRRIAGGVAAGQRRRLPHGILHGGAALLSVHLGIPGKGGVLLRVVGKRLPARHVVVQRRHLLSVNRLVCVGPQRRYTVAVRQRRRHIL